MVRDDEGGTTTGGTRPPAVDSPGSLAHPGAGERQHPGSSGAQGGAEGDALPDPWAHWPAQPPTTPEEVAAAIDHDAEVTYQAGVRAGRLQCEVKHDAEREAEAYRRGYKAGRRDTVDVVDAAVAYVLAPDGSDGVGQCWYELQDAVANHLSAESARQHATAPPGEGPDRA